MIKSVSVSFNRDVNDAVKEQDKWKKRRICCNRYVLK